MMKLLMSWDIKSGREQDYSEFVGHELIPMMTQMGIQLTDAWHTVYGETTPQILIGGVAEKLETMQKMLESDEWRSLHTKLLDFVTNYSCKVVPASNRFQM